jgi:hypothetical protein
MGRTLWIAGILFLTSLWKCHQILFFCQSYHNRVVFRGIFQSFLRMLCLLSLGFLDRPRNSGRFVKKVADCKRRDLHALFWMGLKHWPSDFILSRPHVTLLS